MIGETNLTPIAIGIDFGLYAKELFVNRKGMRILTSVWNIDEQNQFGVEPSAAIPNVDVEVGWGVSGLVDTHLLPIWRLHFYSAVIQHRNRLFKPSLLDYSVSFEVFLEAYLNRTLSEKLGQSACSYLLRKVWRVDERAKELLELATGHRLTEREDVYRPWKDDVHDVRNDLAHGKIIPLTYNDVERGHQASYQAIRWIESLRGDCWFA